MDGRRRSSSQSRKRKGYSCRSSGRARAASVAAARAARNVLRSSSSPNIAAPFPQPAAKAARTGPLRTISSPDISATFPLPNGGDSLEHFPDMATRVHSSPDISSNLRVLEAAQLVRGRPSSIDYRQRHNAQFFNLKYIQGFPAVSDEQNYSVDGEENGLAGPSEVISNSSHDADSETGEAKDTPWYYRLPGEDVPLDDDSCSESGSDCSYGYMSDNEELDPTYLPRSLEHAIKTQPDVLNLSQDLDRLEVTDADPADLSTSGERPLTTSEVKIGRVQNGQLIRTRSIPRGSDFSLTPWSDNELNELFENFTCRCPGGSPILCNVRICPADSTSTVNAPRKISCTACGATEVVQSPAGFKFNKQTALVSVLHGLEYRQLNSLFLALGLGALPQSTHFQHRSELVKEVFAVASEVLDQNVSDVQDVASAQGYEPDSEGCLQITASGDGTWPIRGFRSPCGLVFLIEHLTKLPIGYAVLSKMCQEKSCLHTSPGSAVEPVGCFKNYSGTSGGMEAAGLLAIIHDLREKYHLKVKFYISDGDTKAYLEIKNKYGGDPIVIKLDCVGHHGKRYPPAAEQARKIYTNDTKKRAEQGLPPLGPPLRAGPGQRSMAKDIKPGSQAMKTLQKCIRAAMDECFISTRYSYHSPEADEAAKHMAFCVRRAFRHCCSDHEDCPATNDTWCAYQKVKLGLRQKHREYMPKSYLVVFEPVINRLTSPEFMKRCVFGTTQNVNESINAIIWAVVRKNLLHGPKTYWMAAGVGIIRFSEGTGGLTRIFERCNQPLGRQLVSWYNELDKRRVLESSQQADKLVTRRKRNLADLAEEIANPAYGPGFDQ